MSCFTQGSSDGTFNGTSNTTVVTAPAANTRRLVRTITIHSKADAIFTLLLLNGVSERTLFRITLKDGETFCFGGDGETLILDDVAKSIAVRLNGTVGTAWDFTAHWGEDT